MIKQDNILSRGTHEGFEWVVTHNGMGFRCGYVIIPNEHPWFNKDYDNIGADVHGGLTYSEPGDNNTWWVGFDCAHLNDVQDLTLPYRVEMNYFKCGTVKTQEYVEKECRSLCEQANKAICSKTKL